VVLTEAGVLVEALVDLILSWLNLPLYKTLLEPGVPDGEVVTLNLVFCLSKVAVVLL
jgi:hypothetical protein